MLTCLNGGTKNSVSCQCTCPSGYTGYNCASKICDLTSSSCGVNGVLNSTTCSCQCSSGSGYNCAGGNIFIFLFVLFDEYLKWFIYLGANCPNFQCQNGGTLNACTCTCPAGFYGYNCAFPSCLGLTCLNGGGVNQATCQCTCPAGYSGYNCRQGIWHSILLQFI